MYISLVGLILGAGCIGYLLKLIFSFKKLINKQNVRLLHAYLDRKLLSKIISIINSSTNDVFDNAMQLIATYYDLNQVAIYCNKNKEFICHPNHNTWLIERYVANNLDKICNQVGKEKFLSDKIDITNQSFIIHVTQFENNKDNFLILVRQGTNSQKDGPYMIDSIREMIMLIFYFSKKST